MPSQHPEQDPRQSFTRRKFLGAAGAGFAAAGLSSAARGQQNDDQPLAPEATESDDVINNPREGDPVSGTARARDGAPTVPGEPPKKLGYAIVGIGKFSAGQLIPAFAETEHCRLTALVSGDRAKAEAFARRYGVDRRNIYNYGNFDEIKNNDDVDIIYIVLPNGLHAEFAIRAAEAGKHVLCEKPMATSVEDCRRMIAACDKHDRKLMIAYRAQYEPYNMKAIEWSREKKYGPLQFIVSDTCIDVGGKNQWRLNKELAGGGSLYDIGIYSLNACRYLTGEMPEAINALEYNDSNDERFKEVEQSIAFQLRFPSGVLANCTSSYSQPGVNRYKVMCKEGWYELDPATNYTGLRFFHGTGDRSEQLFLPQVSHFAAEMDDFAKRLKDDKPPKTPGEEGLKDVRLMELIYQAAREGKTVKVEG